MGKVKELHDSPVAKNVEVQNAYFAWLLERIKPVDDYWCLLRRLHQKEFIWLESVPRDENREEDGKALRLKFAEDSEWSTDDILDILAGPCSVLEMLVALSIRIEEDIMYEAKYGNRTGEWFWMIIRNAGLDIKDKDYYQFYIDHILDTIMGRRYRKNSDGSFFPVKNTGGRDWRKTELWLQMQLYSDENM